MTKAVGRPWKGGGRSRKGQGKAMERPRYQARLRDVSRAADTAGLHDVWVVAGGVGAVWRWHAKSDSAMPSMNRASWFYLDYSQVTVSAGSPVLRPQHEVIRAILLKGSPYLFYGLCCCPVLRAEERQEKAEVRERSGNGKAVKW